VIGKFSFSVGAEYDDSAVAAVAGDLGTGASGRVAGLVRLAGLAGALLAVGAGLLVVARLRGRSGRWWRETSHDVRRLVTVGARLAVVAAVLQVPAEAWLRAGGAEGLGAAVVGVLGGTVGLSVLVRIVAFAPFAVPVRTTSPVLVLGLWVVGLAGFVVEGHSISEEPFLVVALADMVHLVAGAVWFGGLVALAVVLRRATETTDAAGVADVVGWFSSTAAVAVVGAGLAGTVLAVVGVGSLEAATGTTYGVLVLAKVALVAVVVGIGGWNRFALVPRIQAGVRAVPEGATAGTVVPLAPRTVSVAHEAIVQLQRTVRIEAVLLVGVLVLTVLLAGQPTP
jgi:copper transport protein